MDSAGKHLVEYDPERVNIREVTYRRVVRLLRRRVLETADPVSRYTTVAAGASPEVLPRQNSDQLSN